MDFYTDPNDPQRSFLYAGRKPCPNIANCTENYGHPNCHNCNPIYERRRLCHVCGGQSYGGRLFTNDSNDTLGICHACFDEVYSDRMKTKGWGYYRAFENGLRANGY